jgi:hypothetical protein
MVEANLSTFQKRRRIKFDRIANFLKSLVGAPGVCTENSIRVDDVTESPKLAE